jgi:hypothetical protein
MPSGCADITAPVSGILNLQSGGSIGLWQSYFGDGLTYYGLDVNPYCQVWPLLAVLGNARWLGSSWNSPFLVVWTQRFKRFTPYTIAIRSTNSRLTTQELFNNPPRVNIMLGDQGDRGFWQRFREQVAEANVKFDIILDDGEQKHCWTMPCPSTVTRRICHACTSCSALPGAILQRCTGVSRLTICC